MFVKKSIKVINFLFKQKDLKQVKILHSIGMLFIVLQMNANSHVFSAPFMFLPEVFIFDHCSPFLSILLMDWTNKQTYESYCTLTSNMKEKKGSYKTSCLKICCFLSKSIIKEVDLAMWHWFMVKDRKCLGKLSAIQWIHLGKRKSQSRGGWHRKVPLHWGLGCILIPQFYLQKIMLQKRLISLMFIVH